MFAVVKTGGKQYKVQSGDMFGVEKAGTVFVCRDGYARTRRVSSLQARDWVRSARLEKYLEYLAGLVGARVAECVVSQSAI
ncbi:MAG: bL21 family ribosomal protein [Alphaproteobacteria bacterium]|nr:bL21 family ribosomal protein [Alphaproteobacteria bacterium]